MGKEVKDSRVKGNGYIFYVLLFFFSMAATGVIGKSLNNGNRYEIRFSGGDESKDRDTAKLVEASDKDKLYETRFDVPSVKKFLQAALEPVGTTLYVYGGGWNEDDSGAGTEALTCGVSTRWYEFFRENDKDYNFEDSKYRIHDGLDCTGYVGYVVYQLFKDSYSDKGYVYPSKDMVYKYADLFGGTVINKDSVIKYYPGDIMGTDGHVFIVIGECSDGSLLFVHASPPVVSVCGTKTRDGNPDSEAVLLAKEYMSKYYPESYERYDTCIRDTDFLTDYNQMHWSRSVLSDPDGYDSMTPKEIMTDLFDERD